MPTDDDLDRLLKAVPQAPAHDTSPLDEGKLLAWRDGRLSEADAEQVERRLANDAEARALLRELSLGSTASEVDEVMGAVRPRAKVLPLRRPAALVTGVITALAAAVALFVTRSPSLPTYQLEVEGGVADTRSDVANGAVVLPESRLVIRLRAAAATDTKVALGVYRETVEGRLERVQGGALAARDGSFEFVIDGQRLLVTPGRHRVWLHVARDEAALRAAEGTVPSAGTQWWLLDTELRAP